MQRLTVGGADGKEAYPVRRARRAVGEKMRIPPLPPAGPGDPLSWEKGVAIMERLPPLELPPEPAKS